LESTPTDKLATEKMYEGIIQMFERLHKRFIDFEKDNDDSSATLDYLTKLNGSIGYLAQVHSGLAKAYQHEKRLADIEKRLEKIPPEIIQQYLKSGK